MAGYAEAINLVFDAYDQIPISENHIKQLHRILLKYSSKGTRHRGEYKKLPNHVEAFDQNGKSLGAFQALARPSKTLDSVPSPVQDSGLVKTVLQI